MVTVVTTAVELHWLVLPCTHKPDAVPFWHCDLRAHFCSTVHHPHRGFTLAAQLRQLVKVEHCSMGTLMIFRAEGRGEEECPMTNEDTCDI